MLPSQGRKRETYFMQSIAPSSSENSSIKKIIVNFLPHLGQFQPLSEDQKVKATT